VRGGVGDVRPSLVPVSEFDGALAGLQYPRQQVEERRLPGPVRPDERREFVAEFEVHVVDGGEATEPLRQPRRP